MYICYTSIFKKEKKEEEEEEKTVASFIDLLVFSLVQVSEVISKGAQRVQRPGKMEEKLKDGLRVACIVMSVTPQKKYAQ